jgi:hypothetical protein
MPGLGSSGVKLADFGGIVVNKVFPFKRPPHPDSFKRRLGRWPRPIGALDSRCDISLVRSHT